MNEVFLNVVVEQQILKPLNSTTSSTERCPVEESGQDMAAYWLLYHIGIAYTHGYYTAS